MKRYKNNIEGIDTKEEILNNEPTKRDIELSFPVRNFWNVSNVSEGRIRKPTKSLTLRRKGEEGIYISRTISAIKLDRIYAELARAKAAKAIC